MSKILEKTMIKSSSKKLFTLILSTPACWLPTWRKKNSHRKSSPNTPTAKVTLKFPVIFRTKHFLNCFKSSMAKFANITWSTPAPWSEWQKKQKKLTIGHETTKVQTCQLSRCRLPVFLDFFSSPGFPSFSWYYLWPSSK